ncbi:MAG: hypothetical protein SGJ27_00665 [Candidatus Melainabacteria bacterium]|nr:hypothetical protein [Candidatus Melainabacteria bacterium]
MAQRQVVIREATKLTSLAVVTRVDRANKAYKDNFSGPKRAWNLKIS